MYLLLLAVVLISHFTTIWVQNYQRYSTCQFAIHVHFLPHRKPASGIQHQISKGIVRDTPKSVGTRWPQQAEDLRVCGRDQICLNMYTCVWMYLVQLVDVCYNMLQKFSEANLQPLNYLTPIHVHLYDIHCSVKLKL